MNLQKELEVAVEAAREAGRIIAQYANQNVKVDHKTPEQPVTIADREANEAIKKIILGAFPQDGWLSEETVDDKQRLHNKRVWIVDPLDGTKEFIANIPEYAVSIALADQKKPVVGVVFNPAKNELFQASKTGGAFFEKTPIKVSTQADLSKAKILASNSEMKRGEWKQFENQLGKIIAAGGLAYKMCEVARGNADASFSLSPKNEWDFAAGLLIIEEAGGIVTNPKGDVFTLNNPITRIEGIVYTNQLLYPQIMELIR